ncbi:hypothetical protein [Cupriavidus sp. D384]|uniref:hypothetical protein n=1 Tax=Cupriavidus sp. D384 TaxID=1538095 RepID=UPI0012E6F8DB|nr:hypothetical protein [Cupriavidus sp. D384]
MAIRGLQCVVALGCLLTGCTVISVEGDHNRIRDAGGHGGVVRQQEQEQERGQGQDRARTWLERLERIEQALGIAHRGGQH